MYYLSSIYKNVVYLPAAKQCSKVPSSSTQRTNPWQRNYGLEEHSGNELKVLYSLKTAWKFVLFCLPIPFACAKRTQKQPKTCHASGEDNVRPFGDRFDQLHYYAPQ